MAEVPFRPVRQLSEYKGKGASASRETQDPSCLVFAMFPYPAINCQGLSNLLGLLAVRLNELETVLI